MWVGRLIKNGSREHILIYKLFRYNAEDLQLFIAWWFEKHDFAGMIIWLTIWLYTSFIIVKVLPIGKRVSAIISNDTMTPEKIDEYEHHLLMTWSKYMPMTELTPEDQEENK